MTRKLRLEYPGAICHVMNPGDRREEIFQDDEDRLRFLSPLGQPRQDRLAGSTLGLISDCRLQISRSYIPPLLLGVFALIAGSSRRHQLFGKSYSGEAVQESAEAQTERIVGEGLKRRR